MKARLPARPDFSVITVTWNSENYVRQSLASVAREARDVRVEVLVVDNGSRDSTVEVVRKAAPSGTRLIRLSRNTGYSYANNLGMGLAKGKYIFLLNPDAFLAPGALSVAKAYMDSNPDVGVLAPRVLYPDGRLQLSVRSFPTPSNIFFELTGLPRLIPRLSRWKLNSAGGEEPQEVEQPMGAALVIRREAIGKVGFLDPRLRMFFSDVDILVRIRRHYRVVLHPGFVVYHYLGTSTRLAKPRMALEWAHGLSKYFAKHMPTHPGVWLLNLLNWAVASARCLFYLAAK